MSYAQSCYLGRLGGYTSSQVLNELSPQRRTALSCFPCTYYKHFVQNYFVMNGFYHYYLYKINIRRNQIWIYYTESVRKLAECYLIPICLQIIANLRIYSKPDHSVSLFANHKIQYSKNKTSYQNTRSVSRHFTSCSWELRKILSLPL